tara:strand:+ start:320 stop:1483 length:1164 start_codon:yes stop_codon:yes gene_type:complete
MSWKNKFISKSPVRQNGDPTKPGSFSDVQSGSYGVKPTVKTKASTKPLTKKPITKEELDRQSFEFSQRAKDRNTGGIASGVGGMIENDPKSAEFAGSFLPGVGEAIDAKDFLVDMKDGNYGGAALSAAGFALPFVPGKAIKKFFGYGGDAAKKAPPPKTVDKSIGFNDPVNPNADIDEFNVPRNFRKDQTDFKQKFDILDNKGRVSGKKLYENVFSNIENRANKLDEFSMSNPNWNTKPENFKYLGNDSGRDFIEVNTPAGNQTFYRSTGLGGKAGSKGSWVPFEGYGPNGWFMKTGSEGKFHGNKMSTIYLDKSHPRFKQGEETISVRQQLKEMGLDADEELRKGNLVLDNAGFDFNYTKNPDSKIHQLAKGLNKVSKEMNYPIKY